MSERLRAGRARAENAVIQGDDDLARQAIVRAHEHEAMAAALLEQRKSAERTAQALRGQVNAMSAKQAEARRKLESLSARRQLAETGRGLQRDGRSTSSQKTNGFARFERMHRQIEQAEAEAEALGELYETTELSLEAKPKQTSAPARRGSARTRSKERIRAERTAARIVSLTRLGNCYHRFHELR